MMKTKDGIFKTDPLSEKISSVETRSISAGSDDKEQSSGPDLNSFWWNRSRNYNDPYKRNSAENFEKNWSKTKHHFIVDWEIPEA